MTATDDRQPARVVGRDANRPLGHIALSPTDQATASLVHDTGLLGLWAYETTWLDPDGARDLAAELLWWADTYMADRQPAPTTDGAEQPELFNHTDAAHETALERTP